MCSTAQKDPFSHFFPQACVHQYIRVPPSQGIAIIMVYIWFITLLLYYLFCYQVFLTTSENELKPKEEIELEIYGDPGTQVGLLAIDSSVYLLQDSDKLTGEQVCGDVTLRPGCLF